MLNIVAASSFPVSVPARAVHALGDPAAAAPARRGELILQTRLGTSHEALKSRCSADFRSGETALHLQKTAPYLLVRGEMILPWLV
jgi:hypothetical protein